MKKLITILVVFCTFFSLFAQPAEEEMVIAVIQKLFDGMRAGDSTQVANAFDSSARLQSVFTDQNGHPQMRVSSVTDFAGAVGKPHEDIWDEKIWSYDVKIDDRLATAWTDYTFYAGTRLSHCGVNAFHLYKGTDGWKITQITDTRRRTNCEKDPTIEINSLMDNWHKAAATGDEKVFFGSMGKDAIYIGTDASERWTKSAFETWSKKFFDRDSAWDFKPIERQIHFSESGKTAWFNETLDTWMGICRASGVLEKVEENWQLQHYHLSVTVPNELIEPFLKLMKKE